MQLNLETDYAVRCMLYLAQQDIPTSAHHVSEACGISKIHAQKILRLLHQAELLDVCYGSQGGYSLARDSKDITVYDIVSVMEKTMRINRCMEDDRFCSRGGTTPEVSCPVHRYFVYAQGVLDNFFQATTLQDLLDDKFKEYHD